MNSPHLVGLLGSSTAAPFCVDPPSWPVLVDQVLPTAMSHGIQMPSWLPSSINTSQAGTALLHGQWRSMPAAELCSSLTEAKVEAAQACGDHHRSPGSPAGPLPQQVQPRMVPGLFFTHKPSLSPGKKNPPPSAANSSCSCRPTAGLYMSTV